MPSSNPSPQAYDRLFAQVATFGDDPTTHRGVRTFAILCCTPPCSVWSVAFLVRRLIEGKRQGRCWQASR